MEKIKNMKNVLHVRNTSELFNLIELIHDDVCFNGCGYHSDDEDSMFDHCSPSNYLESEYLKENFRDVVNKCSCNHCTRVDFNARNHTP